MRRHGPNGILGRGARFAKWTSRVREMPLTQTIVGPHRRDGGMNVISLPIVVDESSQPSASGFQRVGSFCYSKAPDRWEWSDAVARMHGYEPGTVLPTTELILSHKHPDDQPAVSEIIDQVLRHGAAFSSRHRIIDTAGDEHVVVVVGDRMLG